MDEYYDAKIQEKIDGHNIEIAKAEMKREKVNADSTEYYILTKIIKQNEKDRNYCRWILSLSASNL